MVGIIFDGNIQSLAWNFVFDDEQGRSVHVDSRGIVEALRHIYDATGLVDELTGNKPRQPQQQINLKATGCARRRFSAQD